MSTLNQILLQKQFLSFQVVFLFLSVIFLYLPILFYFISNHVFSKCFLSFYFKFPLFYFLFIFFYFFYFLFYSLPFFSLYWISTLYPTSPLLFHSNWLTDIEWRENIQTGRKVNKIDPKNNIINFCSGGIKVKTWTVCLFGMLNCNGGSARL